jgi:hypothetical protein
MVLLTPFSNRQRPQHFPATGKRQGPGSTPDNPSTCSVQAAFLLGWCDV